MDQLRLATEIAKKAHDGQKRYNGAPYFSHLERISNQCIDEKNKCIAILHDIIEDTDYNKEKLLKEGIDVEVVDSVYILSRQKDETYYDFILRIKRSGKPNVIAIKLLDINDNISDIEEGSRKDKYRFSQLVLSGV